VDRLFDSREYVRSTLAALREYAGRDLLYPDGQSWQSAKIVPEFWLERLGIRRVGSCHCLEFSEGTIRFEAGASFS